MCIYIVWDIWRAILHRDKQSESRANDFKTISHVKFPSASEHADESATVLRTHEPGQCLVSSGAKFQRLKKLIFNLAGDIF